MKDLKSFRARKDDFFAHDYRSPLTPEQKNTFDGLDYFPEAEALRIEAAVEILAGDQSIQIPTSTGDFQSYQRYGVARFQVDGQEVSLTIYTSSYGFFLPFIDSQAGEETYPAGRYLEPELLPDGKFLLDFNLAYNPYCAYNDMWSCPLTPAENRLNVAIRAGEKSFHR